MPRRKKCPNPSCTFVFTNNVSVCPLCKAAIGTSNNVEGSGPEVSTTRSKADKSNAVSKHPTVYIGDGVFSVQYWQYNRCFVRVTSELYDTEGDTNFCTKFNCSENRRLATRNDEEFECPHIEKVLSELKKKLVITT
jgi:hypothetical protein